MRPDGDRPPPDDDLEPRSGSAQPAASFVTTEHFTLQTARAATIQDSATRSSLFLAAVSSSVVALAFIGQISRLGPAFHAFAFVLLPALLVLGALTFVRVLQSGAEDYLYARAINRLRRYYLERAPELAAYLVLSEREDAPGIRANMGLRPGRLQFLFTGATFVGAVEAILAGVTGGLASGVALRTSTAASAGVGLLVTAVTALTLVCWQLSVWRRAEALAPPLDRHGPAASFDT